MSIEPIDFENIQRMIHSIEESQIPDSLTFNSFAMHFYRNVKLIPLSKYLHTIGKGKRLPKIMYFKKAGEFLLDSEDDPEIRAYLRRNGYDQIPQLNYQCILLLRKTDNLHNWQKILRFFEGKSSIEEINRLSRPALLPQEIQSLTRYIVQSLNINEHELQWLLTIVRKANQDKKLAKALSKLAANESDTKD